MTDINDFLFEAKQLHVRAENERVLEEQTMYELGSIACALIALCDRLDSVIDGDVGALGVFDTSRQPR